MNFSKIIDNKIKIIAIDSNDLMKNKGIRVHNPTIDKLEDALDLAEDSKIDFIYLTGTIPKSLTKYYRFLDNYTPKKNISKTDNNVIYGNFSKSNTIASGKEEAKILSFKKD